MVDKGRLEDKNRFKKSSREGCQTLVAQGMMRTSIVTNNIKIYVDLKENGTVMAVVQLQQQRETPDRRTLRTVCSPRFHLMISPRLFFHIEDRSLQIIQEFSAGSTSTENKCGPMTP